MLPVKLVFSFSSQGLHEGNVEVAGFLGPVGVVRLELLPLPRTFGNLTPVMRLPSLFPTMVFTDPVTRLFLLNLVGTV